MKHRTPHLIGLAVLIAASALLMHSCRSHRSAAKPAATATTTAKKSPATPPHRTYTVVSFSGTAEGISFTGQVRVAQDSLIWLNMSKIMELGRAVATPDSVRAYSSLLGIRFGGTYADLQRRTKVQASYQELQRAALGDGFEAYVQRIARQLGYTVSVKVTRREQVERLSFPFTMPTQYR